VEGEEKVSFVIFSFDAYVIISKINRGLVMNKNEILSTLKKLQPKYKKEGLILLGLFGSYAKNRQTKFSDIDIAYRLDYDKFSQNYKDGFSKLLRLDAIKEELQTVFKTPIDLVPDTNKSIVKDMINV